MWPSEGTPEVGPVGRGTKCKQTAPLSAVGGATVSYSPQSSGASPQASKQPKGARTAPWPQRRGARTAPKHRPLSCTAAQPPPPGLIGGQPGARVDPSAHSSAAQARKAGEARLVRRRHSAQQCLPQGPEYDSSAHGRKSRPTSAPPVGGRSPSRPRLAKIPRLFRQRGWCCSLGARSLVVPTSRWSRLSAARNRGSRLTPKGLRKASCGGGGK